MKNFTYDKVRDANTASFEALQLEKLTLLTEEELKRAQGLMNSKAYETLDGNALYKLCFEMLKIGGLQAEIPRLVVFGQQSMGKTTLLDFIMGGPVGYSSTDTGTRVPVVIMLKCSENNETSCRVGNEILDLHELPGKMQQIMKEQCEICCEELEVEISIPRGVEAVFVDLPGIKDDSRKDAELTRNVVRKYVANNPHDFYVMVKKSNDDPANWPWSLREFILCSPPKGLGLVPSQTIVVGTRAKDFLMNEKTDVRTAKELLERVKKRGITDATGQPLPLYLLELFSFSIEEKEAFSFSERRQKMHQRIEKGKKDCFTLLESFQSTDSQTSVELCSFFDSYQFRKHLNEKFQEILSKQLFVLCEQLEKYHSLLKCRIQLIQSQLETISTSNIRETIQLYLRIFFEIAGEIMTGNYTIIQMDNNGVDFLNTHGATLNENLIEGNRWGLDLFPNKVYDDTFLKRITNQVDQRFLMKSSTSVLTQGKNSNRSLQSPRNQTYLSHHDTLQFEKPQPDIHSGLQLGQYVRFFLNNESSHILGHLHSFEKQGNVNNKHILDATSYQEFYVNTSFYYVGENSSEAVKSTAREEMQQIKLLNASQTHLIYPLHEIIAYCNTLPPENFRCWRRYVRHDYWVGLMPVMLRNIKPTDKFFHESTSVPQPALSKTDHQKKHTNENCTLKKSGTADCLFLSSTTGDLTGSVLSHSEPECCSFDQLFCEECSVFPDTFHVYTKCISRSNFSTLQHIAGEFSETKLLNELAITHIIRWFKFHLSRLEPTKQFTEPTLVQLMRSVKHVMDKSDWQPVVADLLQANVHHGMLHLTRLVVSTCAVALSRVLNAAFSELQARIQNGDFSSKLLLLSTSEEFSSFILKSLKNYTKRQATLCYQAMCELMFDLCHTIHFEMVETVFSACETFEKEFLHTHKMKDVTYRLREELCQRRTSFHASSTLSSYTTSSCHTFIYEEVKMQFWVMKMLLSVPLCTKLYTWFLKTIKDRSSHRNHQDSCIRKPEDIEQSLTEDCLQHPSPNKHFLTNEELCNKFALQTQTTNLQKQLQQLQRTEHYILLVIDMVQTLKTCMKTNKSVNFLKLLH